MECTRERKRHRHAGIAVRLDGLALASVSGDLDQGDIVIRRRVRKSKHSAEGLTAFGHGVLSIAGTTAGALLGDDGDAPGVQGAGDGDVTCSGATAALLPSGLQVAKIAVFRNGRGGRQGARRRVHAYLARHSRCGTDGSGGRGPVLGRMKRPKAATTALRTAANAPQPAAVQRGNQRRPCPRSSYPSQCPSSRDDRAKPLENCVPFWEIGHECVTKCFPGQILLCCTSIQGRAIKHSHDNADAPLPHDY
jgi:hypothetical protein